MISWQLTYNNNSFNKFTPCLRHVCLSTCLRSKNIVNCCLKGALHTKKIVLKVVSCLDLHKHTIFTIHGDYTVLQHQITYFGDLGPDHVYKWIVTECKFNWNFQFTLSFLFNAKTLSVFQLRKVNCKFQEWIVG